MYFKFQENLPTSVLRAVFDFYKENDPAHSFPSLTAAIQHKSTLLEVPEQATHLRAIRFLTAHSSFLYYFPDEGYPLEKGSFLPPLRSYAVGDCYAGGMVMQTGVDRQENAVEEDILPYKGKILALEEQTACYQEEKEERNATKEEDFVSWHLPDILELAAIYHHQDELNGLLGKLGGMPLREGNYWCRDNSVIELGVVFHMATGQPSIVPKDQLHQIRLVHSY